MWGGSSFGGSPWAGLLSVGLYTLAIKSEVIGKYQSEIYYKSEIIGGGPHVEYKSEISGTIQEHVEYKSEVLGGGPHVEYKSEVLGVLQGNIWYKSEIVGLKKLDRELGYKIVVYDKDGNILGQHNRFKSVEFGKRLNDYGESSFTILENDENTSRYVNLRKNYIEIYRLIGNKSTLVWAGEQAHATGDLTPSRDNWITVRSYTWFELLLHRFTAAVQDYRDPPIDAGLIVYDLVTKTNLEGDTKIRVPYVTFTKSRERTYYNNNIGEAIINLANVISGFDFKILDEDRAMIIMPVVGEDRTESVVFKYGFNITDVRIEQDFVNPATRAIVLGEAIGENTLQRVEREDSTAKSDYGLYEMRLNETDVSTVPTLQDKGDAALRKYANPLMKISFNIVGNTSPSIDEFDCGDIITIVAKGSYYNIVGYYRVFEWYVTYDEAGVERLDLLVGDFIL